MILGSLWEHCILNTCYCHSTCRDDTPILSHPNILRLRGVMLYTGLVDICIHSMEGRSIFEDRAGAWHCFKILTQAHTHTYAYLLRATSPSTRVKLRHLLLCRGIGGQHMQLNLMHCNKWNINEINELWTDSALMLASQTIRTRLHFCPEFASEKDMMSFIFSQMPCRLRFLWIQAPKTCPQKRRKANWRWANGTITWV